MSLMTDREREIRLRLREDLPGDESSFVAAIRFFDDTAHFPNRQLHIVECDAGFELHGVEQHFGPEWNCNRTEHVILLHETRSLGARGGGIQCDVISIALDSPGPMVGQDTFQKTVHGLQIVQAAFLFYWDQGQILYECPCEKADSVVRFDVLVEERNLRDAATR